MTQSSVAQKALSSSDFLALVTLFLRARESHSRVSTWILLLIAFSRSRMFRLSKDYTQEHPSFLRAI